MQYIHWGLIWEQNSLIRIQSYNNWIG
jgi:hypothetical protein